MEEKGCVGTVTQVIEERMYVATISADQKCFCRLAGGGPGLD